MSEQMTLVDHIRNHRATTPRRTPRPVSESWRLDTHTREVGRRGLADARAHLAEARRANLDRLSADAAPAGDHHPDDHGLAA